MRTVCAVVALCAISAFGQVPRTGGGGSGGGAPSGTAGGCLSGTYPNPGLSASCSTGAAFTSVTDGSPITWALASAFVVNGSVTLAHTTGTRALNLTGLTSGGNYTLVIKQDSTGGAAMTLGTGCTWKVGGGGSGAITLTSAANAIDVLAFTYDGTNCYANFQTNFN